MVEKTSLSILGPSKQQKLFDAVKPTLEKHPDGGQLIRLNLPSGMSKSQLDSLVNFLKKSPIKDLIQERPPE